MHYSAREVTVWSRSGSELKLQIDGWPLVEHGMKSTTHDCTRGLGRVAKNDVVSYAQRLIANHALLVAPLLTTIPLHARECHMGYVFGSFQGSIQLGSVVR